MTKFAGLGAGPAFGVGAVALAAAVGAAAIFLRPEADPAAPPPELSAPAQSTPSEDKATAVEPAPEAAADAAPEDDMAQPGAPAPPRIDTFRLDPDGSMLVAGKAAPGWETLVLVDGATLDAVTPDAQGNFVAFLSLEPSGMPRILSLLMRKEGAADVASRDEIIITPVAQPVPDPAPEDTAAADPALAGVAPAEPEMVQEPASTGDSTGAEMAPPEQPEAPAIVSGDAPAVLSGDAPEDVPAQTTPEEAPLDVASDAPEIGPETAPETATAEPAAPEAQTATPAAPGPAAQNVSEAVPAETPPDPPSDTLGVAAAPEPLTPEQPAPEQPAPEQLAPEQPMQQPRAQAVLRSSEDGVEVIQPAPPPDAASEAMASVALDAISYSDAGAVQLEGRGREDGFVRVYLDNAQVATAPILPDGRWRTELPEVDSGVYTLRVDEVDADGTVLSRVETPFQRETADRIAESRGALGESPRTETRISAVIVQPGSTLWAISRERYGEGILYLRVYDVNRNRIRDPDLIYPGQVFTLPE